MEKRSVDIYKTLQKQFQSTGEISYLVLHKRQGQLYLAAFISSYSNDRQRIGPPKLFVVCDISEGRMVTTFSPTPQQFSAVPVRSVDTLYSHDAEYGSLCLKLDEILENYEAAHDFRRILPAYAAYMQQITPWIPDGLQQYYDFLSIPVSGAVQTEQQEEKAEKKTEEPSEKDEPAPQEESVRSEGQPAAAPGQGKTEEVKRAAEADKKTASGPEKKAEENKETEKNAPAPMDWIPKVNLSTMPQPMYSILLRVAQRVRILDTDGKMLHYSYPVFCFNKDRKTDSEPWLELAVRMHNRTLSFGHFKTPMRPTIYMTCSRGKNGECVFGRCPYYAALYIRMLSERDPDELKRQRAEYKKNRRAIDSRQSPALIRNMTVAVQPDNKQLKQGLSLWDTGTIFMTPTGKGTVKIEHIDNSKKEWTIVRDEIPESELHGIGGQIKKTDGTLLSEDLYNAIIAGYFVQLTQERPPVLPQAAQPQTTQLQEAPIKAFQPQEKKPQVAQVQAEPKQTASKQPEAVKQPEEKTEIQKQPEKPEKNDGVTERTLMVWRNQQATNCFKDPDAHAFYGTLLTAGNREDDRKACRITVSYLQSKGCRRFLDTEDEELPEKLDPSVLYVIHSRKKAVPFQRDAKVLRIMSKREYALSEKSAPADPCLECIVWLGQDMAELYQSIRDQLPDDLKARCTDEKLTDFKKWANSREEWPVLKDERDQAAYIAWLCRIHKTLVFEKAGQKEEGK